VRRDLAATAQVVNRGQDVVVQIEPRLIGLAVGSQVYGLSADTLARLQDEEGMPVVRIGNRRLIPVALADEWFNRRAGAA